MKDGFIKAACGTPEIRVADCDYNAGAIIALARQAAGAGVKLLVLPELCITGYTCGDLFLQQTLLDGARDALKKIMRETAKLDMLLFAGLPLARQGRLYNCAAAISGGELLGLVPKSNLPNYGEFQEKRWFTPAPERADYYDLWEDTVPFGRDLLFTCETMPELCIAAEICEDLWVPVPPAVRHTAAGAALVVNLSAGGEAVGKAAYRRLLVTGISARLNCGYLYANAGTGESTTDAVFSGHSMIAENGVLLAEKPPFAGGLVCTELDVQRIWQDRRRLTAGAAVDDRGYLHSSFTLQKRETPLSRAVSPLPFIPADKAERDTGCEEILQIQAHGLRKRLAHSRAKSSVIGISGGLDSALALLVTVRAFDLLGQDRAGIVAVTMPCFGTTARTRGNAGVLCDRLGIELRQIDIKNAVDGHFADIGHDPAVRDVTFENAQARERTQVLMDLANETGGLVVGTGDLSELALGWATYNGDHMSMYGVNAGVPKTLVRHLVAYEAERTGDPELRRVLFDILDTPVSPELLPPQNGEIGQITEDLVGPYELHDFFLYYMLRWGFPPRKIYRMARRAFAGRYDGETLLQWLTSYYRRFFSQQFKRSCLPDGPKVGSISLSPRGDWRMPSDACAALWLKELDQMGEMECE